MGKVTLAFSRDHTISTALIRLQTWSAWSHVGIVIPSEYGSDWVIEARLKSGVRRITLFQFMRDASEYALKDVEVPDPSAAYKFAYDQIGKPYDIWGVIGLGINREWDEDDKWWCSELTEACIKAGGRIRFSKDVRRLTPEHVWMVA
jgi:uncharacterized protein YycO